MRLPVHDEIGPLAECWAKSNRASFHLDDLNQRIQGFNSEETNTFALASQVDVERSLHYLRIQIYKPLPVAWSLILGDVLHNFRAALDYMVWKLVIANGNRPSGSNCFPIFDVEPSKRRDNGERMRFERSLQGVHPSARNLIQWMQPYKGDNGPRAHLLAALRTLSNQDKHRFVVASHSAAMRPPKGATHLPLDLDWERTRDIRRIYGTQLHAERALQHDDIVTTSNVEIIGPKPHVELKGTLPVDIAFGESPVPFKEFYKLREAIETTLGTVEFRCFGFDRRQYVASASTEMG